MGFNPVSVQQMKTMLEGHVATGSPPGLVALVARADETEAVAAGRMALDGPAPMPRDAIFRLASMTKPVTAIAALMLIEEGKLRLDEPVQRLLPELADKRVLRTLSSQVDDTVPALRPITVEDLLTFRLGWGVLFDQDLPIQKAIEGVPGFGMPDPTSPLTPDAYMRRLHDLPLMAQPGERWLYNTGASVLGVLIARAAGRPLAEFLRQRVFAPLGIDDTAFFTTDTGRLATSYGMRDGELIVWDPPDGAWSRPPAFGDGATGLLSTADDLLALARMLLRGGAPVLSQASVRAMTSGQLTPEQKARGGLVPGFFADRSWGFCQQVLDSGGYGWDGGLGTSWLVDPGRDLVVVVLTQRMFDSPQTPQAHRDVQVAAYAALA